MDMRNHKLLINISGDLEHAVKFRFRKIRSIDDIANVVQDFRKKTSIGISSPDRSHDSRGKRKILMEKDIKPTNDVKAPRSINTYHNFGSPGTMKIIVPKEKENKFNRGRVSRGAHRVQI
ncbi:hypothetical protein O181_008574 [Austropuccinia psidii MF-1]|uniref:Uncharacterized protein n=1 Tax=Austropuccinia psidii MF-1 TaxID=1389203 RepID=A0A9Q3BP44_9BASI|nr:hypothetical protein [Austropuccinia psidii MF-1]